MDIRVSFMIVFKHNDYGLHIYFNIIVLAELVIFCITQYALFYIAVFVFCNRIIY